MNPHQGMKLNWKFHRGGGVQTKKKNFCGRGMDSFSNSTFDDLLHQHDLVLFFSSDPRMWNKWEVMEWLKWATERYSIRDVTADKFLMNGKGLCMLSVEGFLYRVPRGGDILHSDFNKRVTAAVEQSRHLQSYLNPGTSNFYYVY